MRGLTSPSLPRRTLRTWRGRGAATAAFALLALLTVGCRPLYLPPVPDAPPFEAGPRISAYEAMLDEEGRPRLEIQVADGANGWLAVQWLAPSGEEAASASVRVSESEPGAVFVLPADVELTGGEWRAVVSLGGRLLRQFTFLID